MAYGNFKDLNRRAGVDKVVRDKAFNIAENPKYDGYKRGWYMVNIVYTFQWSINFLIKKTLRGVATLANKSSMKNKNIFNKELWEELHRPVIRKFNEKSALTFINDIWGADLADVQLINKFNERIRFLLSVIKIHSRYTWVIPLKDKKRIAIINAFRSIIGESNRRPNKTWVKAANLTINQWNHSYRIIT